MSHVRHHLSWLLRRFRAALILYAAVWAVVGGVVWRVYDDDDKVQLQLNNILTFFHVVLPVAGLLLFMEALRQDAAPGTGEFWRTRPPRWRAVCCSQAAFALVFVAGPPLLVWFINGLRMNNSAVQWRCGLIDALLIVAPLFALAGVVSFSRRWSGMLLSGTVTAGCFIAGVLLLPCWPAWLRFGRDTDDRFFIGGVIFTGALVLSISWMMGMRRSGVIWRALFAGAGLIAGPVLIQHVNLFGIHPVPLDLTAAFNLSSRPWENGGILNIEGVPEDSVALLRDGKGLWMSYRVPDPDPSKDDWSPPEPVMPNLPVAPSNYFENVPAGPLRALFPGDTRWYSDIREYKSWPDGSSYAGMLDNVLASTRFAGPDMTIKITGTEDGYLISAIRLVSLNLESNAVAAENGTRLLMREMRVREHHLSMKLQMWRASTVGGPVDPAGLQSYTHPHSCLPVLYFPALRMAVLANLPGGADEFRSWQCANRSLVISSSLPSAEVIRGVRFTPETLRGAQLVLCVPVLKGHFILAAPKGTHTLAGPSNPADQENKVARLLRELDDTSFFYPDGSPTQKLSAPAVELLQMGPAALRAMLRYSWRRDNYAHGPLQNPSNAIELWRPLTDEFLPDLRAAARRDHRWVEVARLLGKEEALVPDALESVRRLETPLASVVVSVAALGAKREDYDKLRHHVAVAVEKDYYGLLLWRRLRALPDFPWRDLARRLWREGYEQYEEHDFAPLCAIAALAGETSALNKLLENNPRSPLDPDEWIELLGKIEGVPTPPSAPEWLRENRGYFLWDEAMGKYRVQK